MSINISKSRVAKQEIIVPSSLLVNISDNYINFDYNGKILTKFLPKGVNVIINENSINVCEDSVKSLALAGTISAVIRNAIKGLLNGFSKTLELVGVGYKCSVSQSEMTMNLGYSHPIIYKIPSGISISSNSPTEIVISSHDNVLLGDVVYKIMSFRPVEPYKGKGIRIKNQKIIIKEGKKK